MRPGGLVSPSVYSCAVGQRGLVVALVGLVARRSRGWGQGRGARFALSGARRRSGQKWQTFNSVPFRSIPCRLRGQGCEVLAFAVSD